jgi:serine protease Do
MLKFAQGAAAVAALALVAATPVPTLAQETPRDFTQIVNQMSPAVVAVTAERTIQSRQTPRDMLPRQFRDMVPGPFGGERGTPSVRHGTVLGSGFFISDQGHVVTNNHVIEQSENIEVITSDGESHSAKLVGTDPATDIAVLKIDPPSDVAVAQWGDSEAVKPGAWTIAIGSPYGLGGTVTVGVLSARSRDIHSGPYDNFLQTDASINHGNSGGPLFNAAGRVIGVNTAIFSPVGANIGIGFAVPASTAEDVVSQLMKSGAVERGFIGVTLQTVTDSLADALQLSSTDGALVSDVEADSPAAKAGVEAGDVITAFDGAAVESPRELSRAVAQSAPGSTITLTLQRNGKQKNVDLTLATRQATADDGTSSTGEEQPSSQTKRMGLAVSPLSDEARQQRDGKGGILVQRVEPDSLAAKAGIRQGDVILKAGGKTIEKPEGLVDAWSTARDEDRALLLQIERQDSALFIAVEDDDQNDKG